MQITLKQINRRVSQMLARVVNLRGYSKLLYGYMLFNIKRNIFSSVLHIPALWSFYMSVKYPKGFRRVKLI